VRWGQDRPGDNFYHRFLLSTWLAGLTLEGDSPKAAGYLTHALRRWREEVRPYLETHAAGGYLAEGTHYGTGTMARIWTYLLAHETATSERILSENNFRWPAESISARLYLTTPDMDYLAPLGDQPANVTGRINDQSRMGMLAAMSYGWGDLIRYWLDNVTPAVSQDRLNRWQEFLWYHEDLPPYDYRTAKTNTGYHARGAGVMVARSDWGPDAAMLVMQCGPLREAHQDRAAGGFLLWAGSDWLVSSARVRGHGGLQREAHHNNALTVGGRDQPEGRGYQPEPRVLHFEDTPEFAHMAGEAGGAYTYRGNDNQPHAVLKEWRREILWLKPRFLVLLDRVEKVNPADPVTWHLNTINEPQVDDNRFTVTVPGARLFAHACFHAPVKVPVYEGRGGALSSWRIDETTSATTARCAFLHVLEIAPETQAEPTYLSGGWLDLGDTYEIEVGGQWVRINFNATAPTMMTLLPPAPPAPPAPPEPEPVTVRVKSVSVTGGSGEPLMVTYTLEESA
jgi:hypothetical protein